MEQDKRMMRMMKKIDEIKQLQSVVNQFSGLI